MILLHNTASLVILGHLLSDVQLLQICLHYFIQVSLGLSLPQFLIILRAWSFFLFSCVSLYTLYARTNTIFCLAHNILFFFCSIFLSDYLCSIIHVYFKTSSRSCSLNFFFSLHKSDLKAYASLSCSIVLYTQVLYNLNSILWEKWFAATVLQCSERFPTISYG